MNLKKLTNKKNNLNLKKEILQSLKKQSKEMKRRARK